MQRRATGAASSSTRIFPPSVAACPVSAPPLPQARLREQHSHADTPLCLPPIPSHGVLWIMHVQARVARYLSGAGKAKTEIQNLFILFTFDSGLQHPRVLRSKVQGYAGGVRFIQKISHLAGNDEEEEHVGEDMGEGLVQEPGSEPAIWLQPHQRTPPRPPNYQIIPSQQPWLAIIAPWNCLFACKSTLSGIAFRVCNTV